MIDTHSHILPGIDDGARTLEESLEMCRLSAEDGVRVIVATPHAHDGVHKTHDPESLRSLVQDLNERLGGTPRIELGCELRFTHDIVRHLCVERTGLTIAGGPYVLVEFPHALVPPGSERALYELIGNKIRPIIAHPERNQMLMDTPERFYELVDMGVLGQVDTGSITGQFGKRVQQTAELMLEHGLLHLIASDCHNTRNRLPGLSAAVVEAADFVGQEMALAMVDDNPWAVLEGRPIPFRPAPAAPRRRKRWYLLGR